PWQRMCRAARSRKTRGKWPKYGLKRWALQQLSPASTDGTVIVVTVGNLASKVCNFGKASFETRSDQMSMYKRDEWRYARRARACRAATCDAPCVVVGSALRSLQWSIDRKR